MPISKWVNISYILQISYCIPIVISVILSISAIRSCITIVDVIISVVICTFPFYIIINSIVSIAIICNVGSIVCISAIDAGISSFFILVLIFYVFINELWKYVAKSIIMPDGNVDIFLWLLTRLDFNLIPIAIDSKLNFTLALQQYLIPIACHAYLYMRIGNKYSVSIPTYIQLIITLFYI